MSKLIFTMTIAFALATIAHAQTAKCGGKEYNTATHFCHNNKILSKCGWEEYNPEYRICNDGRWLSFFSNETGGLNKAKEKAKIVKKRIDEYGFASEKLSEFLVREIAQCFRYRQAAGDGWKRESDRELKKMEFSSVVLDLGDDEDAELSLVKENGKWKVFHIGPSMQCQ